VGKYRKKVRGETPAACVIWSVVVASNPSRAKSIRAASVNASRVRAALTARGVGVIATIGPCYRRS
jgi:hypothetical protein